MQHYFFLLGNAYELCLAELTTFLRAYRISYTSWTKPPLFIIDTTEEIDLAGWVAQLGGVIKAGKLFAEIPHVSDIAPTIANTITEDNSTYGVTSFVPDESTQSLLSDVKKLLRQKGIRSRYIESKQEEYGLSAVVIVKQDATEYIACADPKSGRMFVGKTEAVQDVEAWGKREFGRPYADPRSGMLPIKIARMMVNLIPRSDGDTDKVLADPFCGMGTIVAEALMVGFSTVGSDISADVVKKAQKNIEWLQSTYSQQVFKPTQWVVSDAVHLSTQLSHNSLDAIVAEPFLGSPFEFFRGQLSQKGRPATVANIQNTLKGLEKLYLGCLKDWHGLLRDGGHICLALPSITYQTRTYFVKKLIDNCEKLGYTIIGGPYLYGRPHAIVKRAIYIFQKKA